MRPLMLAVEFVGAAARYLFEDVCCSIGDAVRRLPCGKRSRVIIPRDERLSWSCYLSGGEPRVPDDDQRVSSTSSDY